MAHPVAIAEWPRSESAAVPSAAAGSIAAVGILAVTQPTVDGRPAWPIEWIHDVIRRFVPGLIPIVAGHNEPDVPATVVGHLSSLEAVPEGLRFGALVTMAAAERLQARGGYAAVSSERRVAIAGPHTVTLDLAVAPSSPLVAIAILDDDERPANPSSWIRVR